MEATELNRRQITAPNTSHKWEDPIDKIDFFSFLSLTICIVDRSNFPTLHLHPVRTIKNICASCVLVYVLKWLTKPATCFTYASYTNQWNYYLALRKLLKLTNIIQLSQLKNSKAYQKNAYEKSNILSWPFLFRQKQIHFHHQVLFSYGYIMKATDLRPSERQAYAHSTWGPHSHSHRSRQNQLKGEELHILRTASPLSPSALDCPPFQH